MAPSRLDDNLAMLDDEQPFQYETEDVDDELEKLRSSHPNHTSEQISEEIKGQIERSKKTLKGLVAKQEPLKRRIAFLQRLLQRHENSSTWLKNATQRQKEQAALEISDADIFGRRKPQSELTKIPAANLVMSGKRQSQGARQAFEALSLSRSGSVPRSREGSPLTSYRPNSQGARRKSNLQTQGAPQNQNPNPYPYPPWDTVTDKPRENSPATFYSGGNATQRKPPKANEDNDYAPPPTRNIPRSSRVTRQAAQKNMEPIEIMSSDEETENANPPKQPDGQSAKDSDIPRPRRSERLNAWQTTTAKYEGLKALYPPDGGKTSVQILPSDLSRLDPGEFLNDTVIDFYMKWIHDHLGPENEKRFHFFNSFFYAKLTEKSGDSLGKDTMSRRKLNHERVRKWTKGIDIFNKDFIFVPIHDHLHWSLVIIFYPSHSTIGHEPSKPSLLVHLDSLESGHQQATVSSALRGYLAEEWEAKIKEPDTTPSEWRKALPDDPLPDFSASIMPSKKPSHLPRQDNYCDCGLFALTYMHYFSYMPPESLNINNLQGLGDHPEGFPLMFTKDWFTKSNAGLLRNTLRELILNLFVEQAKDKTSPAVVNALTEITELANEKEKYQSPEAALSDNDRLRSQIRKKKAEDAEKKRSDAETKKREAEEKAEREKLALKFSSGFEIFPEGCDQIIRQSPDGDSVEEVYLDNPDDGMEDCIQDSDVDPSDFGIVKNERRATTRSMNEKKVTQIPLDSPFSQKFSLSKEEEVGNTQYVVAFKSKLVLGDKRKFNTRPQAMDFMKSETSPSAGGGKRQRPGSGESPRNGELKSQKSGPPFKKGKGNIQTMECSNSALQTLSGYESDSPTKSQPQTKRRYESTEPENDTNQQKGPKTRLPGLNSGLNSNSGVLGSSILRSSSMGKAYIQNYEGKANKDSFASLALDTVRGDEDLRPLGQRVLDHAALINRNDGRKSEVLQNAQNLSGQRKHIGRGLAKVVHILGDKWTSPKSPPQGPKAETQEEGNRKEIEVLFPNGDTQIVNRPKDVEYQNDETNRPIRANKGALSRIQSHLSDNQKLARRRSPRVSPQKPQPQTHIDPSEIVNVDSEDSYSSEDLGNLGSPSENEVNGSAKRLKDLSLDSDQAISVLSEGEQPKEGGPSKRQKRRLKDKQRAEKLKLKLAAEKMRNNAS